jgi:hypothetical protein
MANWVVVAFGVAGSPDWCEVSPCPMSCFGPFPEVEDAHRLAARMYPWQQPHVLRLDPPAWAVLRETIENDRGVTDG